MDQAIQSHTPGSLGARLGKLLLYLTCLVLPVVAWLRAPQGVFGRPIPDLICLLLPLLWVLLLDGLPSLLARKRIRRLIALGRKGRINPPGYFRLSPYSGGREDRDAYHRADGEHDAVYQWLLRDEARLSYLTGRSGTGKSSLLNASVLPRLGGPPHFWKVLTLQAGSDPLGALTQALLEPGRIWEHPPTAVKDLNLLLARAGGQSTYPLLVVWDQFEEFLIHCDADPARMQAFTHLMGRMLGNGPQRLKFLLVFRTDYLRAFLNLDLPRPQAGRNWQEVSPFTPKDARAFLRGSELGISHKLLDHLLHEIYEIEETKGLVRPVTLNMIGLVLARSSKSERAHLGYEHGMMTLMDNALRAVLRAPTLRRYAPMLLRPMLTEDGTKQERGVTELAWETGMDPDLLRGCLVHLANHHLVRRLDPITDRWTIAHDFVAKQLDLILRRRRHDPNRRRRLVVIVAGLVFWSLTVFAAVPTLSRTWRDRTIAQIVAQGGEVREDLQGVVVRFRTHPRLDQTAAYLADLSNFYKLDLGHSQVTDLTALQQVPGLRALNLEGAQGADLDTLADLPGLQELNLTGLPLTRLDGLSTLHGLQSLDLSDTKVEHLSPLAGFPQLTALALNDTALRSQKAERKDIDFNTLSLQELMRVDVAPEDAPYLTDLRLAKGLTRLDCRNTFVDNLAPLTDLPQLTALSLEQTQVEDLTPLQNLPRLTYLDLRRTRVRDLTPLRHNTRLADLLLAQTKVVDLTPLAELAYLTHLDLARTDAADLAPLAGLQALRRLNLSYTFVGDVTPLAGLVALQELDLSGSSVTDLHAAGDMAQLIHLNLAETGICDLSALGAAQNLQHLDLTRTCVTDLTPLYGLRRLKTLILVGTPLTLEDLKALRRALPAVRIEMPSLK